MCLDSSTLLASPLCTLGWFTKMEIYILDNSSICPVKQIRHKFSPNGAILKTFRMKKKSNERQKYLISMIKSSFQLRKFHPQHALMNIEYMTFMKTKLENLFQHLANSTTIHIMLARPRASKS